MVRFVGIMGPTGVGKSAVAVALAKRIGGEIVSADSMQIYRGMDIGTAKISTLEMDGVIHHMLDIVDVDCSYSSFDYMTEANSVIDGIIARNNVPIVVGGTGLYFYSLLYGLDHNNSSNADIRAQLTELYNSRGVVGLVDLLKSVDANALDVIDCNNYKRVIRAIEIANAGGSVVNNLPKSPTVDAKLFVLNRDRNVMYDNIDCRVDAMIANGLVDEVSALYAKYDNCRTSQSLQAIGYKEIISSIVGDCTLDQAIDDVKRGSRRYAKRQLSYFRRLPATWIDCDSRTVGDIVDCICDELTRRPS